MTQRVTARRSTRLGASLVAMVLSAAALVGCSQTPFADDSFEEKIPAALEASDLGITEALASKGVDGMTTYVFVGATFDRSQLSTEDVQEFVTLIVENNTVSINNFRLSVTDAAGLDLKIKAQLSELGAEPFEGNFLNLSNDDAQAIAGGDVR